MSGQSRERHSGIIPGMDRRAGTWLDVNTAELVAETLANGGGLDVSTVGQRIAVLHETHNLLLAVTQGKELDREERVFLEGSLSKLLHRPKKGLRRDLARATDESGFAYRLAFRDVMEEIAECEGRLVRAQVEPPPVPVRRKSPSGHGKRR